MRWLASALKPSVSRPPRLTARRLARRRLRGGDSAVGIDRADGDAGGVERGDDAARRPARIGVVGDVLELAAAAVGEVAARRRRVIGARRDLERREADAVAGHRRGHEAAVGGDPVAARGEPDDRRPSRSVLGGAHRAATAVGDELRAGRRRSARPAAPPGVAVQPCSRAGGVEGVEALREQGGDDAG